MTAATDREPNFRRAALLMTATSFLVPAAGLLTAPILAHGLGAEGRGILAAALAPSVLMLNLATFGLPESLTFHLARRPSMTRHLVAWASGATILLGLLTVGATALVLPLLSDGDAELARLIFIATVSTVPALFVGVLRGAATGRQMWRYVAFERLILTVGRLVALGALFLTDTLTVLTAIVVNVALPAIAGVAYIAVGARPPLDMDQDVEESGTVAPLFSYGVRMWWGSVAQITIARLAPLLMVPLSSAYELGLYTVGVTVADVPLIVALAIQGALFGVSSRNRVAARVTDTARLSTLLACVGSAALAVTLPWWIEPLFGADFGAALGPTVVLLASAVLCVPGLMAAGGLGSWDRPDLRSWGLALTLAAYLGALIVLVPLYGAWGAAWASVVSNVVMSTFMIVAAARVLGVSPWDFLRFRRHDFSRSWELAVRVVRKVLPGSAKATKRSTDDESSDA